MDVACNSFGLLFSITIYSSYPILLNILFLTPALVLYFQAPEKQKKKAKPEKPNVDPQKGQKAFVTVYRGGMMVITCLAILAVDFKLFPRRFAKAETWGTSLVHLCFQTMLI